MYLEIKQYQRYITKQRLCLSHLSMQVLCPRLSFSQKYLKYLPAHFLKKLCLFCYFLIYHVQILTFLIKKNLSSFCLSQFPSLILLHPYHKFLVVSSVYILLLSQVVYYYCFICCKICSLCLELLVDSFLKFCLVFYVPLCFLRYVKH